MHLFLTFLNIRHEDLVEGHTIKQLPRASPDLCTSLLTRQKNELKQQFCTSLLIEFHNMHRKGHINSSGHLNTSISAPCLFCLKTYSLYAVLNREASMDFKGGASPYAFYNMESFERKSVPSNLLV